MRPDPQKLARDFRAADRVTFGGAQCIEAARKLAAAVEAMAGEDLQPAPASDEMLSRLDEIVERWHDGQPLGDADIGCLIALAAAARGLAGEEPSADARADMERSLIDALAGRPCEFDQPRGCLLAFKQGFITGLCLPCRAREARAADEKRGG